MNKTLVSALAFLSTVSLANSAEAAVMFTSQINGGNIVPEPIDSPITGFAELYLNDAQTELSYSITLNNAALDTEGGTVTKIHFHTGFANETSPFHVLNIYGTADDNNAVFSSLDDPITVTGIWDDSDACTDDNCEIDPNTTKALTPYLDDLLADGLYIKIHTTTVGSGEIRGQITAVSVPESQPISIFGLGTAIALGTGLKSRSDKAKK